MFHVKQLRGESLCRPFDVTDAAGPQSRYSQVESDDLRPNPCPEGDRACSGSSRLLDGPNVSRETVATSFPCSC